MSLTGKLEIFPLEEVLRLLARSHQTGCLRVEGQGAGSIYLADGSLTYAAIESDDALRDYLITGGIATPEGINQLTASNGTLADALAPDASTTTLADAIREQSVESVYRIRRPQSGPFSFTVDAQPRYATGQRFDVEMIVSEADRRAAEWAEIEEVVPDLSLRWRMVPAIDEESVQLSDTAWRFLAGMEGSSSVVEIARRLGMTKFQAARRTAELSRARLIEVSTEASSAAAASSAEQVPAAPTYETPAAVTYDTQPAAEETSPTPVAEVPTAFEPAPEPFAAAEATTAPDPDRGWWAETQEAETPEAGTLEPVTSEPTVDSSQDEGFLEKVFGELEQTEDADASSEESNDDSDDDDDAGFGLLRRRGLGAAFRELADS